MSLSERSPGATLIIGVGGATNSGKTTLAKHLLRLLPKECSGVILHQDDFALPEAELPWNRTLEARDWDHPIGTIDYRRMEDVLQYARIHGTLPNHHSSHDHLNAQPDLPINDQTFEQTLRTRIAEALAQANVKRVILADGFLLYYDANVRSLLDVRLFLRCTAKTLKQRREQRGGYATAEQTVWQDPPGYFEHVVWPAYIEAHKRMFVEQDVQHGSLVQVDKDGQQDGSPLANITLIEAESIDIGQTVQHAVNAIVQATKRT